MLLNILIELSLDEQEWWCMRQRVCHTAMTSFKFLPGCISFFYPGLQQSWSGVSWSLYLSYDGRVLKAAR
jgi:hypothetical protein